MKSRYGFLWMVSLLGVIGCVVHEPMYFPFFGFVLFFEYFFVQPDEMFVDHMRKAAAWAFYAHLAVTAVVTCVCAAAEPQAAQALTTGIGAGFGTAVLVFCLATACFDWKDRRGVTND